MRALAGISLMPTSQLTEYETKLGKLKSCASLIESDLGASPFCPHCRFKPANEQGELLAAANALKQLDDELDRLVDGWTATLLENLEDPTIQANFELLAPAARAQVQAFVTGSQLPDPLLPEFVAAVQDALSALQKIPVTAGDLKQALLDGGSPATPDDLLKRFEAFIAERCKGRDRSKVRVVVE
jgi:hypothetical protein